MSLRRRFSGPDFWCEGERLLVQAGRTDPHDRLEPVDGHGPAQRNSADHLPRHTIPSKTIWPCWDSRLLGLLVLVPVFPGKSPLSEGHAVGLPFDHFDACRLAQVSGVELHGIGRGLLGRLAHVAKHRGGREYDAGGDDCQNIDKKNVDHQRSDERQHPMAQNVEQAARQGRRAQAVEPISRLR